MVPAVCPGGRGGRGGGPGGFGGSGASGAAYASVIAIDFDGQREYVQFLARALVGVAASDGKFLWRYDRPANRMGINCSTPVHHDGLVFAASAYDAGGGLVKLSKDAGGGVKAEEVYSTAKMQNHHGGMILVDGCLYGANGGNGGGFLVCLDFQTGKVLWDERDSGQRRAPKGSLALADGRLYYRTEKGAMLLIEPNPKQYVERGRFDQPDRSEFAGLDAPGHCQRQTVPARPRRAAVLRHQGEVGVAPGKEVTPALNGPRGQSHLPRDRPGWR